MTELNFPSESEDAAAKVSAELLTGAVVVGVIAYAVGKSVLSWLENLEDKRVDFYVAKAKLYEKMRGQLNERQEKVLARMFKEGIDGFEGGLSAENYISIAKTSRATATRDLQDLLQKGALTKTGELRHTRYYLNIAADKGITEVAAS